MKTNDFPLQQGSLDWLCSIYAAINVMHVYGIVSTRDEAAVPFWKALKFMQLNEAWDLARAVCEGIDEEDCVQLFNKLSGRNWDICSVSEYPDRLSRLKYLLDSGAKAVIVSLVTDARGKREVIHYTVVLECSSTGITIFDSQGKTITRNGGSLQYDGIDVSLGDFFIMKSK